MVKGARNKNEYRLNCIVLRNETRSGTKRKAKRERFSFKRFGTETKRKRFFSKGLETGTKRQRFFENLKGKQKRFRESVAEQKAKRQRSKPFLSEP